MDIVPVKAVNPTPRSSESTARPWERRAYAASLSAQAGMSPSGAVRSGWGASSPADDGMSPRAGVEGGPRLFSTGDDAANLSPNALPKVDLAVSPMRAAAAFQPTSLQGMAQQMFDIGTTLELQTSTAEGTRLADQVVREAGSLAQVEVGAKTPALEEAESVLSYAINTAKADEAYPGFANDDPELSLALRRLLNAAEGVLGVA